jgi:hypothetical protein
MPEPRTLTLTQLAAEARERFGPNPAQWAFQCPMCGDIATAADFPPEMREAVSIDCVGRYRGALSAPDADPTGAQPQRGCGYSAHGLVHGPWEITLPDGGSLHCFPLAPAPDKTDEETGPEAHTDTAGQAPADAFAYWAMWTGEPLVLTALHEFDATCSAAAARAQIETYDSDNPEQVPWTTGAPYLLEPLTGPRLRMLRRLAQSDPGHWDLVTWADAHGFEPAEQGVGCRHCAKDSSAHLGYTVS